MEYRLVSLKLILDTLGIPNKVESFNQRKKIQKLIYLLKAWGVNLGYHYGWYLYGPYSPSLARDYFELETLTNLGEKFEGQKLPEKIEQKITKLKTIINKPDGVELDEADWFELLSSIHFLKYISRYDKNKMEEFLNKEKPRISKYFNKAYPLADRISKDL